MPLTNSGARVRRLARQVRQPWRVPVDGLDRLPAGPVIVACGRWGPFDHAIVSSSLDRPSVVALEPDAGLLRLPGVRTTHWTADPADPSGPAGVLARGEVLVVFPEGCAGRDNAVHKGYPAVAGLALSARTPIVPAALVQISHPVQGRIHQLRLGEAVHLGRLEGVHPLSDTLDGYILRGITDTVMARISELAGRDYRDSYAEANTSAGRRSVPGGLLREFRGDWKRRRAELARQRAAEAELARELDEQDRADLAEAAEAAARQAERAALAAELARAQRRGQSVSTPNDPEPA